MSRIGIINYGMGNLDSVARAVEECGGDPEILTDAGQFDTVSALILPGVGAYAEGMQHLREAGMVAALEGEVFGNDIPFLGICLGMQLLAERGFEGSDDGIPGLGWVPGEVRRLPPAERVPHVGWNEVYPDDDNPASEALFAGVDGGHDFYFVHSYHFVPAYDEVRAASTPYCGGFCSAVARDHIWGVQFHPEKSQKMGFRILTNFIEAAC